MQVVKQIKQLDHNLKVLISQFTASTVKGGSKETGF